MTASIDYRSEQKLKALGRPRGFDIEEAVRRAQAQFWRQGFAATSLSALASAIGVHKPSLYAAYGDKRDLYLAAYDAYEKEAGALVLKALAQPSLSEALTAFFAVDLDWFLADDGRGCFMLATAVPLALTDGDVAIRVRHGLIALQTAIADRVEQGRQAFELDAAIEPATAADIVMSTHIALANRARAGEGRAALEPIARRVIALICSKI